MKRLLLSIAFLFTMLLAQANNIQVTNMSLTGQNTSSKFTLVQFTVGWENSWRDNVNWDAAWVFVKYRVPGGSGGDNNWRHATLSATAAQHTAPTGATINPTSDGVGAFLYRSSNGGGTINYTNVQLRWNYGTNLKSNIVGNFVGDNDQVEVQVYAIEMVYVPQGAYYLGDGTTNNIAGQFEAANTGAPYLVTGEIGITLGGAGPGSLGNRNTSGMAVVDDFTNSVSRTLPAAFPKGFNAFYCMKFETTQKQYADFLNSLSSTQATTLFPQSPSNGMAISGFWPNYNSTLPSVPVNQITSNMAMAYLDWSALRPMTELEFEKACRGSQLPVVDEMAFGTTDVRVVTGLTGSGTANELASNIGANANIGNPSGIIGRMTRVGMFATNTSTRESSGATYYGIMEMSGNLWEWVVTVGRSNNRSFVGSHGDGILNTNGNANNSDWPGFDGSSVVVAPYGLKGGSFVETSSRFTRVSERSNINYAATSAAPNNVGARGVRTNP